MKGSAPGLNRFKGGFGASEAAVVLEWERGGSPGMPSTRTVRARRPLHLKARLTADILSPPYELQFIRPALLAGG